MVNTRGVGRDQLLSMPPSVSAWLPGDHLAWFVLDVVAELEFDERGRELAGEAATSGRSHLTRGSLHWLGQDSTVASTFG